MTQLNYLENTYLFTGDATLIEIDTDEKGMYCILDKTIFYPQSGGQASDIGRIKNNGDEFLYHLLAV